MFEENIAKGVQYLDARIKGWKHCVDVNTLDMGSAYVCVLGQIYGGYYRTQDWWGIDRFREFSALCESLGFVVAASGEWETTENNFKRLTEEWKAYLGTGSDAADRGMKRALAQGQ